MNQKTPQMLFRPGQVKVDSHRFRNGMADPIVASIQTPGGLSVHQHGGRHLVDELAQHYASNPELLKQFMLNPPENPYNCYAEHIAAMAFATFDAIQDEFNKRNAEAVAEAEAEQEQEGEHDGVATTDEAC